MQGEAGFLVSDDISKAGKTPKYNGVIGCIKESRSYHSSFLWERCTMPTFVLSGNNEKSCLDSKRGCRILKPCVTYLNTYTRDF